MLGGNKYLQHCLDSEAAVHAMNTKQVAVSQYSTNFPWAPQTRILQMPWNAVGDSCSDCGVNEMCLLCWPKVGLAIMNEALHVISDLPCRHSFDLRSPGDIISVTILSPYRGQVRALEALIRSLPALPPNQTLLASSVDGYQGREADVIVFTTVR